MINEVVESQKHKLMQSIRQSVQLLDNQQYEKAFEGFQKVHKTALELKNTEFVSRALSWIGLSVYLMNPKHYFKAINILDDSKTIARQNNSQCALYVNAYACAFIESLEGNVHLAIKILEDASKIEEVCKFIAYRGLSLLAKLYESVNLADKAYNSYNETVALVQGTEFNNVIPELQAKLEAMKKIQAAAVMTPLAPLKLLDETFTDENVEKDPLIALLRVGRSVAAESSIDRLLEVVAQETKIALNADRCTVFLIDKNTNELWSKVALGMDTKEIRFPVNAGLAGHVAITGETINIIDAYNDTRFNKDIDLQTGYKTKTILCMPIRNINHEIVGVFQVLNKNRGQFTDKDEDLLIAIGSSAGIALENARLFNDQQTMLEEQKQLFSSFIDTLAASIDARDKITSGHSTRVTLYSALICNELNLDSKSQEMIRHAAMLHDIGKIGIRDSVLQKEGKLTSEEYAHIQEHVNITNDILCKIFSSKDFAQVVEAASSHHEKYDGTGYYRKLQGEEIPLGGRILAVSDVFDAITSRRHYRDKMPIEKAVEIIIQGAGSHFDKKIADAFLNITLDKLVEVFLTESCKSIPAEHKAFLKGFKVFDLYAILDKNTPGTHSKQAQELIDVFHLYY